MDGGEGLGCCDMDTEHGNMAEPVVGTDRPWPLSSSTSPGYYRNNNNSSSTSNHHHNNNNNNNNHHNTSRPMPLLMLSPDLLQIEMNRLQELSKLSQADWDIESAQYEQVLNTNDVMDRVTKSMAARRNYWNPLGIVQDESLYPYHTALYPLLDAYDLLYRGAAARAGGGGGGAAAATAGADGPYHHQPPPPLPGHHPRHRQQRHDFVDQEEEDDEDEDDDDDDDEEEMMEEGGNVAMDAFGPRAKTDLARLITFAPQQLTEELVYRELQHQLYRSLMIDEINCYLPVSWTAIGRCLLTHIPLPDLLRPSSPSRTVLPGQILSEPFLNRVAIWKPLILQQQQPPPYSSLPLEDDGQDAWNNEHVRKTMESYWAENLRQLARDNYPAQAATALNDPQLLMSSPRPNNIVYGVQGLPEDRVQRSRILLKLWRHALSELQRDYELAHAVLALLAAHHDFDSVDILRELLVILDAEYVNCGSPCDSLRDDDNGEGHLHVPIGEDHVCAEWRNLIRYDLPLAIDLGMTEMTHEHALTMAAYCRDVYMREFGHLLISTSTSAAAAAASDGEDMGVAAAASAATFTTGDGSSADVEEKRKNLLKRAILTLRIEDDADEERRLGSERMPIQLVAALVATLSYRAGLERTRLFEMIENNTNTPPPPSGHAEDSGDSVHQSRQRLRTMERVLHSYLHSRAALLDIGIMTLWILPAHEHFNMIASLLVRAMYCAMFPVEDVQARFSARMERQYKIWINEPSTAHDDDDDDDDDDYNPIFAEYRARLGMENMTTMGGSGNCLPSLVRSPLRYANPVLDATARASQVRRAIQQCRDNTNMYGESSGLLLDAIGRALYEPPSIIREVVRGLFVREMIDVRLTGMGYGDFCVWTGYDIHPLDPALFWHEYAFPYEEPADEDEDGDSVDSDNDSVSWDVDQNNHFVTKGELKACHDLSLLLLVRAWQAPWSPERHASFQPGFREAVVTVALCTHRLAMPNDIAQRVAAFLNRDWWPDDRKTCWSYDCSLERMVHWVRRQQPVGPSSISLLPLPPSMNANSYKRCPRCRLSMYCSKRCKEADYKAEHKKRCGRPPFASSPSPDEALFLSQILGEDCRILVDIDIGHAASSDIHDSSMNNPPLAESEDDDVADDDDDGEGSWESMDSDEGADDEQELSRTRIIYNFFNKRASTN